MEASRRYLPGIVVAVLIGLAGQLAGRWLPAVGGVTIALLIGMLLSGVMRRRGGYAEGVALVEQRLLPLTIVLLGVELKPRVLLELGLPGLGLIVGLVSVTIAASLALGRVLGFSRRFSLLLGCGNAICGSNAIASVGKTIKASEQEAGPAVAAVNLMGTLGIFALPLLAVSLGFSDSRSGALIGGTLQAVNQVVAAGYSLNPTVGQLAVLIKMGRVLMLGPIVIMLGLICRQQPGERSGWPVPGFIVGFFALALLGSLSWFPAGLTAALAKASGYMLAIAMASSGLKIDLPSLVRQGPAIIAAELAIAAMQIACACLAVRWLF